MNEKGSKFYDIQDSRRIFGSELELHRFLKTLLIKRHRVYELKHSRGELVPYHSHAVPEMILVLEGKMRLIIEEDIVDLAEGEMITIQPHAIHLAAFPFAGGARFYLCTPGKNSAD